MDPGVKSRRKGRSAEQIPPSLSPPLPPRLSLSGQGDKAANTLTVRGRWLPFKVVWLGDGSCKLGSVVSKWCKLDTGGSGGLGWRLRACRSHISNYFFILRESLKSITCLCLEAEGYSKSTCAYVPCSLFWGGDAQNQKQTVENTFGALRTALKLFPLRFILNPKRLVALRCRGVSSSAPATCLLGSEEKQTLILNLQSTV